MPATACNQIFLFICGMMRCPHESQYSKDECLDSLTLNQIQRKHTPIRLQS